MVQDREHADARTSPEGLPASAQASEAELHRLTTDVLDEIIQSWMHDARDAGKAILGGLSDMESSGAGYGS